MSMFIAECPHCGVRYLHIFIGTELYAGHDCPHADEPPEFDELPLDTNDWS